MHPPHSKRHQIQLLHQFIAALRWRLHCWRRFVIVNDGKNHHQWRLSRAIVWWQYRNTLQWNEILRCDSWETILICENRLKWGIIAFLCWNFASTERSSGNSTGYRHIDKTFETITEREMWCQWNHAIKCYCMRFLDWGNLRRFELDFLSLLTFHFNKSSGKNITKENECDVQTKISWIGTIFNSILLSLSRFDV